MTTASDAETLDAPLPHWTLAVEQHLVRAAPLLCAIRLASGHWLTGLLWGSDLVITANAALLGQEAYTVRLAGGEPRAAQALRRDASKNIAALKLIGAGPEVAPELAVAPAPGTVVLVAEAGPAPGGRLSVVRDRSGALESPAGYLAEGGPVLDSQGALIGLCVSGAHGMPRVVGHSAITAFLTGNAGSLRQQGWIGVAMQPVSLLGRLRAAIGQSSGRLVLGVTAGGPAAQAGVRTGDVVLALDGVPLHGRGSLRALLGPERIGRPIALSIARDGQVFTRYLMVGGAQ